MAARRWGGEGVKITPKQIQLALAGVGAFLAALLLSRRASKEPGSDGSFFGPPETDAKPPVDPYATHEPAGEARDLTEKPGVVAFRNWAIARWGERAGSPRNIVADKPGEHGEGRAWDQMVDSVGQGQQIADELLASEGTEPHALARRAGIMYMIWNNQIWRSYPWKGAPSGAWGPYSGKSAHADHLHYSFGWPGAMGETSLYSMIGPTPIA